MKTTALAVILVSAVAVATAVAPDLAWAQPECTEVWFQLEDPLHDPPCTCTIVATESILSGDYLIQEVDGACFMVCQPCP